MLENQTAGNSNHQGVKETFIQNGRRGGDGHPGGDDQRQQQCGRLCRGGGGWLTGKLKTQNLWM